MRSVFPLLEPHIKRICEAEGVDLWGLSISRGRRPTLTVFVESASTPTTLDTCAKISTHLNEFFIENPPVAGAYTLEVSSPGMDRYIFSLKQFEGLVGSNVRIKLLRLVENRRWLLGRVAGVDHDSNSLSLTGTQINDVDIEFENIDWARLVPDFSAALAG